MRRVYFLLFALCLATACERLVPADRTNWAISENGYGPIRFGMTARQVRRALGRPLIAIMDFDNPRNCIIAEVDGEPGLHFIFRNDELWLIDAHTAQVPWSQYRFERGVEESRLRSAYGATLRTMPDPERPPPAHGAVFFDERRRLGMRFNINGRGQAMRLYAGRILDLNIPDCYR